MIKFKSIEVIGFGSLLGPYTYNLDYPGLTIIKGEVGTGKTTLIDALLWALYGVKTKNKSSVNPWPHLLGKSYQGTKVTVIFKKGKTEYKVVRCSEWQGKIDGKKGSNRLIIYEDGVPLDKNRDKSDNKKDVVTIIGYSLQLFKSSVLFGQRVKRFMEEDGPTRKKIMEEAFEIGYISKALALAQDKLKSARSELSGLESSKETTESQIATLKKAIQSVKDVIENSKKNKERRIGELDLQIENMEIELSERMERVESNSNVPGELKRAKEKLDRLVAKDKSAEIERQIYKINVDIKSLENVWAKELGEINKDKQKLLNVPTDCYNCGKPLDKEGVKVSVGVINKSISDHKKYIKKLKAQIEHYKTTATELEGQLSSHLDTKAKIDNTSARISKLENDNSTLLNDRKMVVYIQNNLEGLKESLAELHKEEIEDNTGDLQIRVNKLSNHVEELEPQLKAQLKEVELLTWAVKEPLGNAGLKAFIFDSMMETLNAKLSRYTSILGFKIKMGINLHTALKEFYVSITRNGDEIPSTDLSGGQTQLTNLVIAISCHEIISSSKPTNLLIMDECFEGLGDREIDMVGDLFLNIIQNKSVHLITHRNFSPTNCRLVEVEINNGVTAIYNR